MPFFKVTQRPLLLFTVFLLFALETFSAHAQTNTNTKTPWPKQAIRIIVTFTPGGAPDILARILAESWQQSLGVPVWLRTVLAMAAISVLIW